MPIDASKVQWDDVPAIDPNMVQWDQPASEIPSPRKQYSLTDVPVQAGKNLPESAGKFLGGVTQAILHPVDTLSNVLDIGAGALQNVLPKGVVDFVNKFDSDPEAASRAVQAANAVGGMYKDRYGDYESIKRTFAEDPVGAVADLSMLLIGGGAAATKLGATRTGATMTRAGNLTNPMRPIVPLVEVPVRLGAKGVNAAWNALDPKSAVYLASVEGRGQDVLNALRSPSEIVPGSAPTAAQAASPVGATRFSALGEAAAKYDPTPYYQRGEAQKAAQLAAVRKVGKTPADLAAAEAGRAATAKRLYGEADKARVIPDSELGALMDRPSMDKVMDRAQQLAQERGVPFMEGRNVPAQVHPASPVSEWQMQTVTPRQFASYPGSSLHTMKMAFDDLIANPERFGIGAAEVSAIRNTRGKFLEWAEKNAPDYKTARTTFAKQSEPINQMQVGQFLEGKLKPALGEESARLRAAGYAGALENAPGTIKRSTGQSRYEHLSEILTPDQIKVLDDVRADLARAAQTERQAAAARGSMSALGELGSKTVGVARAPNVLNTVVSVANNIMQRLQGKLDQKLAIELAAEMVDPKLAAAALEKALTRQAKGAKRGAAARAIGGAASNVLRTPALYNALAPLNYNSLNEQ